MCRQPRRVCSNHSCEGSAQILELIPCKKRPDCHITFTIIPAHLRSTERHCPNCRGVTYQERKAQTDKAWHTAHKEVRRARDQERRANGAEDSAHAGVTQRAESSIMGQSRSVVGGGFLPHSGDLLSLSEETEEPFLLPEDYSVTRSNVFTSSPNQRHTEPASDSEATVEQDQSTNSCLGVTHGSEETNPGGVALASNDVPQHPASEFYLAPGFGMPPREYPRTPSPTLTERITWFQAELARVNAARIVNPPRDDAADSPPPWNLMPPQFPPVPPPSPQTVFNHSLFTIDGDYFTGADPSEIKFIWPGSSDSQKEGE